MATVYLCGPITGESYDGATDWRAEAASRLGAAGITALSPLRGKAYLANERAIAGAYEEHPLSSARGITTRDRWDATRCDVLLANFLGAQRVSIGSVMEVAWADSRRIPIVIAMNECGLHDHPMVRECAGYIAPTLDEALAIVVAILGTKG